jgi:hypothetical protein
MLDESKPGQTVLSQTFTAEQELGQAMERYRIL